MRTFSLWLAASLALVGQDPLPSAGTDECADARADARYRYEKVEAELGRARLDRLTSEQRVARARVLEVLNAYVERADFGIQCCDPDARLPQFVDAQGRRCAVAELLYATGEDSLVRAVASSNNTAWIADLASDEHFLGWLDQHGLSLEEAARIQGPALTSRRFDTPEYEGPSDTGGAGLAAPGTRAGGRGVAPSPSEPATPGAMTPAGPNRPGLPGAAFTESDSSWWQWWEYNKVQFLRPNRLQPATADDGAVGRTLVAQLDFVRRAMIPSLVHALEHPDARIRAAAAGALGRIAGAEAVEPLIPLLDDPNPSVAGAALLGLGASGAREAQPVLVRIAEQGKVGSAIALGRRSRALAIVALGLGRRVGFDASADDTVVKLATQDLAVGHEAIGVAVMTYALLNESEKLTALAAQFSSDRQQPIALRCRAVEALRARDDSASLSALQHLASGSRIELRRSAALALGEFEHPLAVAGLMTAHDLEKEPVASSYLLVSLGRRGGERAREHLIATLRGKRSAQRPWAALALGILARESADPLAVQALRDALPYEANSENRCAFWLALGLSRSPEALGTLAHALREAADSNSRMYAAQALALVGGDAARAALLERLPVEHSALARSQIALALGVIGDKRDLDEVVGALDTVREPALQGQVAAAIAFHGSSDALGQLGSMVANERLEIAARAAAIDGLGMLLSRGPALSLGESSRSANFPLFPDWLREVYATTF